MSQPPRNVLSQGVISGIPRFVTGAFVRGRWPKADTRVDNLPATKHASDIGGRLWPQLFPQEQRVRSPLWRSEQSSRRKHLKIHSDVLAPGRSPLAAVIVAARGAFEAAVVAFASPLLSHGRVGAATTNERRSRRGHSGTILAIGRFRSWMTSSSPARTR